MEIKTNKVYYAVKYSKSEKNYNFRRIFEFSTQAQAEKYFDDSYAIYANEITAEERTKTTVFLVRMCNNEEDVIAYFGMNLSFSNGAPMWVSRSFIKGG